MQTRKRVIAAAAAVAIGQVMASWAQGQIVTPAGLNPGDPFYLVFVTASTTTSASNDPTVYDAIVSTEASNAGLTTYGGSAVTWETLGSFDSGPDAISRFNPNAPVYNLAGQLVAANASELWGGTIENPIDIEANGSTAPAGTEVWTGTATDGQTEINVDGPETFSKAIGSSSSPVVEYGDASDSDGMWIADATALQDLDSALYGFSSELTVPVPEPASAGVMAVGLALGASRRVARRR